MTIPPRPLIAALALSIGLAACSPTTGSSEGEETVTTSPPTSTTSTVATTTTTVPATTTTEAPLAIVRVSGEIDDDLAAAISQFMSTVQDPRNNAAGVDPSLLEHHTAHASELASSYVGTASVRELSIGGSVAVVELDSGDLVLAADEGDGWTAVGLHLRSLGASPWFGPTPARVLVLGSDARPGTDPEVHRMDSIHILTAVPEQQAGSILGYPRDSYVETEYGDMRINAVTTSGRGPDALFSHFTEAWEIPLDGYILTGFSGFEKLIGAVLGRLFIDLPNGIPTQKYYAGFRSGEQSLTPVRSLDFARTRKLIPGGDFTRSWHHGLMMKATLTMLQDRPLSDIPMLLEELVKYTDTNLTATDLVRLAAAAFDMDIAEISNTVLPGTIGRSPAGASVVLLDDGYEDIVADVIEDGLLDSTEG